MNTIIALLYYTACTSEVSLLTNSTALIRPVPLNKVTSSKETCPKSICLMKRKNSNSWWVQCASCDQWFHIRCVKMTKQQAETTDFKCKFVDSSVDHYSFE